MTQLWVDIAHQTMMLILCRRIQCVTIAKHIFDVIVGLVVCHFTFLVDWTIGIIFDLWVHCVCRFGASLCPTLIVDPLFYLPIYFMFTVFNWMKICQFLSKHELFLRCFHKVCAWLIHYLILHATFYTSS